MTRTKAELAQRHVEPLIGEELISISLGGYALLFEFERFKLNIAGAFDLSSALHPAILFEPEKQAGDIHKLWPLIGHTVAKADWDDVITLTFDDGTVLSIRPCSTSFRGSLHGKFPPPGTIMVEDF